MCCLELVWGVAKKKEGVAKVQPKDMKNKKKENKVAEGMQEKEVLF